MTASSLARDPEQITKIVEDHSRLTDLIAAGDAAGFAAAVRATCERSTRSERGAGDDSRQGRRSRRRPALRRPPAALDAGRGGDVRGRVGRHEFTPLLVMYKLDHGFTQVVVDTFLFAYVLGIVPALLIGGPLSDRLGRRPLMIPRRSSRSPVTGAGDGAELGRRADRRTRVVGCRAGAGDGRRRELAQGTVRHRIAIRLPGRAGARRAAMSLTAGFGIGAGVAGILAQWAPWPSALAYLVHSALSLAAGLALLRAPETPACSTKNERRSLARDLKIPAVGHRASCTSSRRSRRGCSGRPHPRTPCARAHEPAAAQCPWRSRRCCA